MKEGKEDSISVIKQNDPFLVEIPHLDFRFLRSEGLRHIGDLSGKIWTDHNAHDPGITILEVLCYALVDLGYRTALPVEDLLASGEKITKKSPDSQPEKFFFTPLEILTCNPTTTTDYRKLLLEVKGVRNAWLEPAKEQEVPLFLNDKSSGEGSPKPGLTCLDDPDNITAIYLNGLYQILIEKEQEAPEDKIIEDVREILSAHRNLCEDFKNITILCSLQVGICADVEIEKNADKTSIYKAIIKAIQSYIAPGISYYTLQQLLEKNKPIEEVFAGRPLSKDSFGFVDTRELEDLPRRKKLYASDLYQAILAIDGVVAVFELTFQTPGSDFRTSNIQQLTLPDDHVGVFDLDRTCIQIRSGQGILQLDKTGIHSELLQNGKSRLNPSSLDLPIPEGTVYPELADYYSIQHDFPLVYGIGEGGLSAEATPQRKMQALQLKGYLLFFDHLLANYLAQISNLGNLFSLRQESERHGEERRTYFSQSLEDVPGVDQLLQIQAAKSLNEGYLIAIPVANDNALAKKLQELAINPGGELRIKDSCNIPEDGLAHFAYTSETHRDVQLQQAIRNCDRGEYTFEIHEDKNGKFFLLRFNRLSEFVFIGYPRYNSFSEVREAANFAAFMASVPEYYRKTIRQNESDKIEYQFALTYNPSAYTNYLSYLQENEQLYYQRREAFLDHLLARFANQFTDYSLLEFSTSEAGRQEQQQAIEDKSKFINRFDTISRDRGRAFDYRKPSWGTDNVSGYEKRIALLTGMPDSKRRRLCKFEVVQKYRIELPDIEGNTWLTGIDSYSSDEEIRTAKAELRDQLRNPNNYTELQQHYNNFNPEMIDRTFSEVPTSENICEAEHHYALQLNNINEAVLLTSKKQDYQKQAGAWSGLSRFLKEIKSELPDLDLYEIDNKSRTYLNNQQLKYQVQVSKGQKKGTKKNKTGEKLPPRFTWQLNDTESKKVLKADRIFDSEQQAKKDFQVILRDLIIKQPESDVAQKVYKINLLPVLAFRFVYCLNTAEGKCEPFLVSEQEYTTKKEAEDAFTDFVRALPEGMFEEGKPSNKIIVSEENAVLLIDDTEDNREKAQRLLKYFKERYSESNETGTAGQSRWIYRLIDKDNPIAEGNAGFGILKDVRFKSEDESHFDNKEEAEDKKRELCRFKPFPLNPKKQVIKIVCPELSPGKFHFALCLADEDGAIFTPLISYMGYLSKETAREAADANWLKIIALATDKANYGVNKPISLKEEYSEEIDICKETNSYLAVIPDSFKPDGHIQPQEKAMDLAKRYPIRISYNKDREGNPTDIIEGYFFQGFDLGFGKWVWRSKKIYPGIQEAIEAYRLFVVILGNPDSCCVVCEKGFYKIVLVEILIESTNKFDTESKAWDEPLDIQKDDCGKQICIHQGVRLFTDSAVSETAFSHVIEKDCYRFKVVDKHYHLANHTCSYHSISDRNDALKKVQKFASSLEYEDYRLTQEMKYFIGNGYYLKSLDNFPNLKKSEIEQRILEWMQYAVVRKNITEQQDKYILTHPTQGNMAEIYQEEGGFSVDEFIKIARQYPIFKKGESFCFRLFFPENGSDFDEELQICGCEEKNAFHSEIEEFCGKAYLFESSHCYPCLSAAEKAFRLFLSLSQNADNYQLSDESGIGPYSFGIIDPSKILAYHPNCHPDQTGAMRAASRVRECLEDHGMHLVEHILLRPQPQDKATCDCLLPVCPDFDCELNWRDELEEDDPCAAEENPPIAYIPGADPYSFWATLVLPAWHQRFRTSEGRLFFREMLHREAPAMVGFNILWLGPRQMCRFESALRRWLDWYCNPDFLCEDRENPLCDLVQCISEFRNDPPCITPEVASGDCSCLSPAQRKNDPCIEESDRLFWSDCPPKPEKVTYRDTHNVTGNTFNVTVDLREAKPTEEKTTSNTEEMAIRQMFSEREDVYKTFILEISDEEVKSLEIFDRAVFFVTHMPALSGYQQLVRSVLGQVKGDKRTKRYQSIETILLNVTWDLLDHLVMANPKNIPEEVKSSLQELFLEMKTKRIDVQKIASGWKNESLQTLLSAPVVEEYIQFIKHL